MENVIRRSVPDHVLRRVLDYNYDGASSTYIHGPGGTIRFSDHPRPVEDWDDEGRPIYRGGIGRDEYGQYSHTHDAPEYSIDPETVAGITWQDVESMLESIAETEN